MGKIMLQAKAKNILLEETVKLIFSKYQRYIKFCLVGGTGCLMNWTILYCLTEFAGLWYIASAVIGTVIANTNNYFINHNWAFGNEKENNKNLATGWVKYLTTAGVCNLIYIGLLALLTEVFGVWYIASAVMAVMISSTFMFLTIRKIVWGKSK